MSDHAKITLSAAELSLAADKNIILTKREVTEKAFALFSSMIPAVHEAFRPVIAEHPELSSAQPRIFKGENYKGFPYVIMDYPAFFEKENVFALRTMFMWGHFISVMLHVKGEYRSLLQTEELTGTNDLFIAAGEEEWEHHFGEDNFVALSSLDDGHKKNLFERDFIKVAFKYDLKDWNNLPELLPKGYRNLSNKLKN